jgi:PAS domain S-box-containing protein
VTSEEDTAQFLRTNQRPKNEGLALKASQEILTRIFESATDGILVLDLNGAICEINRRVTEVFARQDREIIGRKFLELVAPEDLAKVRYAWRSLRREGVLHHLECRVIKSDGSVVWEEINASTLKDESGNINGYVVMDRDITNRKSAIEKLKQSDQQFRILFEAMTEGVALIDAAGIVIQANSSEARISGLDSASQRAGQHFRCPACNYFKADESPLALEDMAAYRAMRKKSPAANLEVKIIRPDDSAIWCNISAVPVVNGFGKVTGAVHTLTDITEQRKLREEREKYLAEITRVQEEERKRLSRELHDETAQSLSLLTLELDAICQREKRVRRDTLRKKLERLRETAEYALNEVRRYSHELRPSILDNLGLVAAVESMVDDLNRENKVKVQLTISGETIRLADEIELALFRIAQEALTNLRKHSRASKAFVYLRFSSHKVKLRIVDNGKGFDLNEADRFAEEGHLGLVGMKERANLIKGTFQIKSGIGAGTKVSIEAPLGESH